MYHTCGDTYDVCQNCLTFHQRCPNHPANQKDTYVQHSQQFLKSDGWGIPEQGQWSKECESCMLTFREQDKVRLISYTCKDQFYLCSNCHLAQKRCPYDPEDTEEGSRVSVMVAILYNDHSFFVPSAMDASPHHVLMCGR